MLPWSATAACNGLPTRERDLAHIQAAVGRKRQPLCGATTIALAVGAVIAKHKMAKHLELNISGITFRFAPRAVRLTRRTAQPPIDAITRAFSSIAA